MNISEKDLKDILKIIDAPTDLNEDFILDVYGYINEGLSEINNSQKDVTIEGINPVEIILYIVGEFSYSIKNRNEQERNEFINNDRIKKDMADVVLDKYLSLSKYQYQENRFVNKYSPSISSLSFFINFITNLLTTFPHNSPSNTLVVDLLNKSLSIIRCVINLLNNGFYTEAFASWRTLHECECTLIVFDKFQDKAILPYLKHMEYGVAYKDAMSDKNKQDKLFEQIKEQMHNLNLKSKDTKKFIEYGWMVNIDEFNLDSTNKLNFRDGLEKLAGLHSYSERYMNSSEILHSTPILIYSNQKYFYYLTLISVYESFFRIEEIFYRFIKTALNNDLVNQYEKIKEVYYPQLTNIHKRESIEFMSWQKIK